jgi:hypothetical protein
LANTAVGTRYAIQLLQRAYPTQGQHSFTLVPSNMQIYLHSFSAYNATAGAMDVGLGCAFNPVPSVWRMYVGNVNGGTPTDVTSTIQAGTSINIFDTTANDGFMVECQKTFGYLTFNIAQAQSGSPVYSYQYWNGAWTTLNLSQTPVYTGTGYVHATFNPPVDWVKGDNGMGVNTGYAIRVRSTTAGGQAVQVTSMRVARWFCYNQSLPATSRVQVIFDQHPDLLDNGEALVPYFQTANNLNAIEAAYQQMS